MGLLIGSAYVLAVLFYIITAFFWVIDAPSPGYCLLRMGAVGVVWAIVMRLVL